jgi:hypothetical protein
MHITTGARFGARSYEVGLDSSDGLAKWPDEWDSWPLAKKARKLTAAADLLVILYAEREKNLLTPEEINIRKAHHVEVMNE